jgi:fructokinase
MLMYDVVAIGELLIDFIPGGISEAGNVLFERNPGGAPGNVLSILAKLGKKTAFISKVGVDQFGEFLISVMKDIGIDTKGIVTTGEANTTLAFVHLDKSGDRSFSFYRKPGADMLLNEKETDLNLVTNTKIFHFGSVSMTHEPSRSATLHAVKTARDNGAIISYDPNLRPPLWDDLNEAKNIIEMGFEYADLLKVSEEELEFLTGFKDLEKGSEIIYKKYGIRLILVTLGSNGCFYRLASRNGGKSGSQTGSQSGSQTGRLDTYNVKTIDTTGAGDAFLGAFLYKLLESNKTPADLGDDELKQMIDFSNAAGSLATVKKGAIPAMPDLEAIANCMRTVEKLV